MKGLMRILMMFGPMLFRQFQKYQRNKSQKASQQADQYVSNEQQQNSKEGRPS